MSIYEREVFKNGRRAAAKQIQDEIMERFAKKNAAKSELIEPKETLTPSLRNKKLCPYCEMYIGYRAFKPHLIKCKQSQ